jgi:tetratricopeptide (TPR) repeat protein
MFDQVMQAPVDIVQKIEYLPQALNASRYLIIFDNFEDMLDATKEPHVVKDELIRHLLETLTINLRESRVMITSRLDFLFTRDSRYQGNILAVTLPDLTQMEAFRLMENMPSLSNIADEEKLLIYEKAGGSPYIIDLVAAAARGVPIGNVLVDIERIEKKFVETTLLSKLYEWLPDDATKRFFRYVSVYRKPVNQDFLVAMGGNDERMGYLLHKSMLNKIAADVYEMHSNTRSFAFDLLEKIDGASGLKETQLTAAEMYLNVGKEKGDVGDLLESRWFYYSAKEYDKAGELVRFLSVFLFRWGFVEQDRRLNEETVESTTGEMKADALRHLGIIRQEQGRYDEAVKMFKESLKIFKELGDKKGIADNIYEVGNVYFWKGRYDEAIKSYNESLKIFKELGDKNGIALALAQMGMIHEEQGRYDEAVKMFKESLKISKELGNKKEIAINLHELGNVYYLKGRYDEAIKSYNESLKIKKELGNKRGIPVTFGQLGKIYLFQGRYYEAVKMFEESLKIFKELGDKKGIADNIRDFGNVYFMERRYDEAIKMYKECLKIDEELGDKRGIASTLIQLGRIFHSQGNYKEALRKSLIAFALFKELNSPNKDLVGKWIINLKEEIGDSLFDKYYKEITANE